LRSSCRAKTLSHPGNPYGLLEDHSNFLEVFEVAPYQLSHARFVMVKTHDTEPVWDKPVDVPEKWIQSLDENVAAS